jgi:ABC-2 type transport system permease protein
VVFVAVTGSPVNLGNLGVAAAGIGMLVTFSLALGILASAATVFFRDLEHLVEVLLMFLFWGSPILYSMALVKGLVTSNWVIQIYLLNPITTAVLSMQSAFWAAGPIGVGHLELRVGISWLASLFLLWIAQRVFNRVQGSFAQEL